MLILFAFFASSIAYAQYRGGPFHQGAPTNAGSDCLNIEIGPRGASIDWTIHWRSGVFAYQLWAGNANRSQRKVQRRILRYWRRGSVRYQAFDARPSSHYWLERIRYNGRSDFVCVSRSAVNAGPVDNPGDGDRPAQPVGAVYAMTNGEGQVPGNVQGPNSIVAYAQAEDGTLSLIGSFPTGGNGGDFDGGEGLDPLISAYALTKTIDNRFVLAVNAGSSSVTSMRVNPDFSLTVVDTADTGDIGPNSIAHVPSTENGVNGLVYVSNITRPEFLALGEPAQQGSIIGYKLLDDGSLTTIPGSVRELENRPSAVQFSPDGDFLVVASINAGAAALASGSQDEVVVYRVRPDGTLSSAPTDGATSTLRGNAENRNLPSAIGFQIVGDNYLVVTEAREFQADGSPPAFPALQDGSVSTWQIQNDGSLAPIDLDVASGENNTGRTACWLDFSDDNTFFVSNAIEAGLAAYRFNGGQIELIDQVAAQGIGATGNNNDPAAAFATTQGWIDLWISDDGKYLYQAYGLSGTIGVFEIDGTQLTFVQEVSGDLPVDNIQGIVSVGQPTGANNNNNTDDNDPKVVRGPNGTKIVWADGSNRFDFAVSHSGNYLFLGFKRPPVVIDQWGVRHRAAVLNVQGRYAVYLRSWAGHRLSFFSN